MSALRNNYFLRKKKVLAVAEISANHGQNFKRAVELIVAAKSSGADAVKFQAYTPDTMTINADDECFKIDHPEWGRRTLYQLYKEAYTPWGWFKRLKKIAEDLGLIFFSTAFDKTAVDFLEELRVPIHKLSSFELVDLALIEYIARTKKPLILSTGMASLGEIKEAVESARKTGAKDLMLLKCVSSYPAKPEGMNLKTIPDMIDRFKVAVGFSDHCSGAGAAVAAVSLGASLIEKHFTLSRKAKTPDSFFSVEPREFKCLIDNIRVAEEAVGCVHYGLISQEKKSLCFRRSLFAAEDINKGELFTEKNLRSIRPSNGLKPKYLRLILGRRARADIRKGTPLSRDLYIRGQKTAPFKGADG